MFYNIDWHIIYQTNKESFMNQGIKTVIYPVRDLVQAKTLYTTLLGVEPYTDGTYYVGFKVGDQEIGLDPNGHNQGMTGPLGYFHVPDIKNSIQSLLGAGAQMQQDIKDVGGGKLIASLKDADGNVIGLIQLP
jgi:predicted enzyme related to lactoylglutathione lyase